MRKSILIITFLLVNVWLYAQQTFPVNGSHDVRPNQYAFTNATIIVDVNTKVEGGTLLVQNKKIQAVGKNLAIPKDYVVVDLKGKFIYPSFIDAFSTYGVGEAGSASAGGFGRRPQVMLSSKKGPYNWNEAIRPETQAFQEFAIDASGAAELKKLGFGSVQTLVRDGIARGSAVFATLGESTENEVVLAPTVAAHYSFNKGSSSNSYPGSLMGSIALLRQTYYDATWYSGQKEEVNISLESFNKLQNIPQFFEVTDVLDILRVHSIAKEFNKNFIIKTSGNEYQRVEEVKKTGSALIVPLNFPKAYDVEDPLAAAAITLSQLKHWEMAPSNPAVLFNNQIPFALTAYGLEKKADFWPNLRSAIAHGLPAAQALKALTQTPAELLGVYDQIGSLSKGKVANFLITSGPIFEEGSLVFENWVQGERYAVNADALSDLRGEFATTIDGVGAANLKISGTLDRYQVSLSSGNTTESIPVKFDRVADRFTLSFVPKGQEGKIRISGYVSSFSPLQFKGEQVDLSGNTSAWTANFTKEAEKKSSSQKGQEKLADLGKVIFPFVSFGNEQLPKSERVLLKNATVWTNESEGILTETDVMLENGKIKALGKNLSAGNAKVVDATGKHVTPGIIDEHSHIALQSINEGGQSVTSEVRMGDVLNSEDVNIYRQLAGGVTTSQLLHGSANAIGGQSQLIKLRWGASPDGLRFEGSDGFIKFALGENVKQSNWGDAGGTRFPQTRMGVEQVFTDAFTRAKEYKAARAAKGDAVRRDLELDALVEILDEERFITCHSYVQSEINMLMNLSDRMGFKINTFTHILEGYKLADKMAERGIAGSTFADWWAYKMEVAEAIPYNAYLMFSQGVVTAINSDDAEMARRLNQEAGKIVKYGGISEEEAFKMVTLNPAKMLHIEDRVGSIKVGKDADVVLWSANPLSIYAKAEQTYVDGIKYWDIEEDVLKQESVKKERARLIQKSLDVKKQGAQTQAAIGTPQRVYNCESMEEQTLENYIY